MGVRGAGRADDLAGPLVVAQKVLVPGQVDGPADLADDPLGSLYEVLVADLPVTAGADSAAGSAARAHAPPPLDGRVLDRRRSQSTPR